MKKILISACLLGDKVRYDGQYLFTSSSILKEWIDEGRVISICPEVSSGIIEYRNFQEDILWVFR
jgi:uncharacterized protein YbbK (DUF523 family)